MSFSPYPAAGIVGLYALLPYILMFVADLAWSWYVDRLVRRGLPLTAARKISQVWAIYEK